MSIISFILASERGPNLDRRFGSPQNYLRAYLLQTGRDPIPLAFTDNDIKDAAERGKANAEDFEPFEHELVRFERFRKEVQAKSLEIVRKSVRSAWIRGFAVGAVVSVAAQLFGYYLAGQL